MTPQEQRDIKRTWGHGKVYRDLLATDTSIGTLCRLQEGYQERGYSGPHWDQGQRMWYLQRFRSHPAEKNVCVHELQRQDSIAMFLDIDAAIGNFEAYWLKVKGF